MSPTYAQTFPSRALKLIVPFPPGAGTDATARIVAQKLSEELHQPVVVENINGANGLLGTKAMATAAPDGYTIGIAAPGPMAIAQFMFPDMPYDPERDFVPVIGVNEGRLALAVANHMEARSVAELIELIRRNPGKFNAANPTTGSVHHLLAETFKLEEHLQFELIPYRGGAAAMNDLVGGHVDLMFNGVSTVEPLEKDGKLRTLMVVGTTRHALLPLVPCSAELGKAYLSGSQWHGIVVPSGTPAAIVVKLHDALFAALNADDVREKLARIGTEVTASSSDDFAALLHSERARWSHVIQVANIKAD
ncbi:Bug family tripartite tricarboxylate transporter substrate binding protein [Pararoseomonas indoligenes]|uniref:Tripartite tricarboxylate transporter substrate binding protein n=1 Tax=Roseomonas indoligenes TaxID=2820811 RepID=A0A940N2T9_9PROT|nr:tripartite tricarboxylate transporter substrate binding protein [Pararoseomonas indoligenes]MBP0495707.1 tripartite tricarboxylate transporter substrate binding protein [Pararoseomonas indoligenes]